MMMASQRPAPAARGAAAVLRQTAEIACQGSSALLSSSYSSKWSQDVVLAVVPPARIPILLARGGHRGSMSHEQKREGGQQEQQ